MRPLKEGDVLINPYYGRIIILKNRWWKFMDGRGAGSTGGPLPVNYPAEGSNWSIDEAYLVDQILTKYGH